MYPYRRLKLRKRPFHHGGRRRIFPLSWYFNTTHSNFATSQHHHHDTHTISLPPPTQPAATMADDTSTGNGSSGSNNISNNSSNYDRLLPNGDNFALYRRLQAEQGELMAAERKRRIDELVEKHNAANTLVGIAALFDGINADADLYYPEVRPRELDDPRWPTGEELWAAVATTPPPATIADVLALREQTAAPAPTRAPTAAPAPTATPTIVAPIERDVPVPTIARRKKAAPSSKPQVQLDKRGLDPSEPRYCVCDDISWGTMVACANRPACKKKWFHLSCIGLDELPPRGTKWYCPDCRKKLILPPPRPRVAAPTTATGMAPPPATGQLEEEELDPSEPRYCVCDDISWGTMVGCDNRPTC
jgi:hypothetical protein